MKMKHLKKYNEYSSYIEKDGYQLTKVNRDKNHYYQYVNGVLYELSGKDEHIVDISDVHYTEENMFYEDQIERYIDYIEEGGILQTFPVDVIEKCSNLEEMLTYLDDEKDGFDIVYSLFSPSPLKSDFNHNEKIYNIYMKPGFYNIISYPEEFGFSEEHSPLDSKGNIDLKQIKTIKDLEESYYDHSDEEPQKEDYDDIDKYESDYEDWEEKCKYYDDDILRGLKDIIKYFDDEKEYHLLDFNHRFAALKEMGKKSVYVEIM